LERLFKVHFNVQGFAGLLAPQIKWEKVTNDDGQRQAYQGESLEENKAIMKD